MGFAWFLVLAFVSALTAPVEADPAPLPTPTVLLDAELAELLTAARRAADGGRAGRLRKLSRRARLSGLLPRLRLGLRRGLQYDYYRDLTFEAAGRNGGDQELTLDASATFALDRLIFAPEQTGLMREQNRAEEDALKRVREVLALVFEVERGFVESLTAVAPDPAFDLSIREHEALLDVLTGGRFSELWRRARARYVRARARERPRNAESTRRPAANGEAQRAEGFDNARPTALERPP